MKRGEHKDLPIPFGKFKDKLIADIDTSYLNYLIGEDWFQVKFQELYNQVKIELVYRTRWGV